jgi:Protein of unknown function, DUF481
MKPLYIFILPFLLIYQKADTQVINIENARMQTDTTGWKGEATGSFTLASNRTRFWAAETDAHVQYKTRKDLWLALANYGLLKSSGEKFTDHALVHLRYNRKLNLLWRWELFTQLQYNTVSSIKTRFLTGTGPRVKIAGKKLIKLYVATALMYEHELEAGVLKRIHQDARNSTYCSFTFTPANNIELSSTTYYQPLLKQISDYRILTQARLRVIAGKKLSIQMRWQYLFDRFPAGNAPKENFQFGTGLGVNF